MSSKINVKTMIIIICFKVSKKMFVDKVYIMIYTFLKRR